MSGLSAKKNDQVMLGKWTKWAKESPVARNAHQGGPPQTGGY